jgi:signal transduction histidine kinase
MRRSSLARRYLVVLVALVTGALVTGGAIQLRASYSENQAALVALQREKALGAAARIEAFVRDIERQLGWTTHAPLLTTDAALDARQLDALRLQRQAPPITELTYIDAAGREQLFVSRLIPDRRRSGLDLKQEPRFREVKGGRAWFGPVYFRKDSEPYMTIAAPLAGGGVVAADVNLKFILDVVSQIKVGKTGLALAVDAKDNLIAHPDISLVLQKTSLAQLPQVKGARTPAADDDLPVARDLKGVEVLTAHSRIPSLDWIVFVEQPVTEAFAPVRASAYRVVFVVLAGIALSVVVSVVLARRMARPIQQLQESAARIGAGELDHQIALRTGDELEALADEFNRMTGRLRESYATLEQKVEDRTRELSESLEQQTATAEILRVISSSPTDLRPVMAAVAENAARLCDAADAQVLRVEGDVLRLVAAHGLASMPSERPITRGNAVGRALLERRTVHIGDIRDALEDFPDTTALAHDVRAMLAVPLLREGHAIGVIRISRAEARPFTDKQVVLLQTFADQAVIAIENVRLFTELEEKNVALAATVERQTATAEILRAISSSPTDVQPVFDTILANALRLGEAHNGAIFTFDGERFRLATTVDVSEEFTRYLRQAEITAGPQTPLRRVALDGQVSHVVDIFGDSSFSPPEAYRREGMRTALAVPLLKEGRLVGALTFHRRLVRPFSPEQITLLQTFADQAVIAIENVRLFKELEEKNAALAESLEQQTATGEILRSISSSPTDVQPVFDSIVGSALRLLEGRTAMVLQVVRDELHLAAMTGSGEADDIVRATFPLPVTQSGPAWHAIQERRPYVVRDTTTDPVVTDNIRRTAPLRGYRSMVLTPMIREGRAIGVIAVTRAQTGGFSPDEVDLLQTFADQAVIAIENVRLFTELQARTADLTRSVSELEALGEVGRTISSTLDFDRVLETIVSRANELAGTDGGAIFEFDEPTRRFHLRATDKFPEGFVAGLRTTAVAYGEGAVGRAAAERQPVQIGDVTDAAAYGGPVRDLLLAAGYRSLLAVPLIAEDEVVGALVVNRRVPGQFPPRVVELLRTFGTQSALAIQNARLFREIEDKSRQLEAANRHKDEFLASMSHELRTPLNAVIGFSEVLLERMFGELNDKQEEYLNDILASGRHLLSLINDILDLAKIEAGRMDLDVEDFELAPAIDNALVLIRERATRKGLTLDTTLPGGLGTVRGDQRKIKQVLVNLLSNAVKFTPEGGRIEVRAERVDGHVEVSVIDTGIGIASDDHDAVFEEFRQVGTDYAKKHEGTGLGLALSRKFVELHGGRIWLKSRPGEGSTFTFTIKVA